MSQWIQHISGEGRIFEVWGQTTASWRVQAPNGSPIGLYDLPLEEYRLCDAPEVWEDVTDQLLECHDSRDMPKAFIGGIQDKEGRMMFEGTFHSKGYRFRKVSGSSLAICGMKWAFVVERKKP